MSSSESCRSAGRSRSSRAPSAGATCSSSPAGRRSTRRRWRSSPTTSSEQARDVLRQIGASLAEAGSGFEHVLRVQCYLLRAEDFERVEPHLGRDVPRAAPRAHDDRDRLHRARNARRGRGHRRHPVMKVVVVGGGVAGPLHRVLPAQARRRRHRARERAPSAPARPPRTATAAGSRPAQAGPLPEPGLTIYGLRALLSADSALYFRPELPAAARPLAGSLLDVLQRARPRARLGGARARSASASSRSSTRWPPTASSSSSTRPG